MTTPSALPAAAPTTTTDVNASIVARATAIARRSRVGHRLPAGTRVLERLRSGCSARELAAIVGTSPDLAARVLRLANSAAYAPARPITALDRAIAFIGDTALRQIVLVTALVTRASETTDGLARFAVARLNADAVRTAVVARWLAVRTGRCEPGEVFTLGLVAELGQLELIGYGGSPYAALVLNAPDPDGTAAAEVALVGTTHCAVGRALAEVWSLPEPVGRAMGDHHDPLASLAADGGSLPEDRGASGPDTGGALGEAVLLLRAAAWLVRDAFSASPSIAAALTGERTTAALSAVGLEAAEIRRELESVRPVVAELLAVFDLSGSTAWSLG